MAVRHSDNRETPFLKVRLHLHIVTHRNGSEVKRNFIERTCVHYSKPRPKVHNVRVRFGGEQATTRPPLGTALLYRQWLREGTTSEASR